MRHQHAILLAVVVAMVPSSLAAQGRCAPARLPKQVPMATRLVDSLALDAALPRTAVPSTTFSLWYGDNGRLTNVLALADSLVARDQAQADDGAIARARLATTIAGSALPLASGESVALRLTVRRDSGGPLALAVGRSIQCGGELMGPSAPSSPVRVAQEDVDAFQRAVPLIAMVAIDAGGLPSDVQIVQSSGSAMLDNLDRKMLGLRRYQPLRVDGYSKSFTARVEIGPPVRRQ